MSSQTPNDAPTRTLGVTITLKKTASPQTMQPFAASAEIPPISKGEIAHQAQQADGLNGLDADTFDQKKA